MDLRAAQRLTPSQYHARRDAERRAAREARRERALRRARAAILRLAPRFSAMREVYLFGSVLRPGAFRRRSDLDIAVVCDDLEEETPFARALEDALGLAVDLRPLCEPLAETVRREGEKVYDRQAPDAA